MKDICTFIEDGRKYFVYGTAILGNFCCEKICEKLGEDAVIAYIESTPEKNQPNEGKEIITPQEAITRSDYNTYVIITGRASAEEMRRNCLAVGFKDENILVVPKEIQEYLKVGYSYPLNRVCFWPPVNYCDDDLLQKIDFYIPDRIEVKIFTKTPAVIERLNRNVDICDELDEVKIMEDSDAILLWDVNREDNLFERYPNKVRMVDRYYWAHTDTLNYVRLYYDSFSKDEQEQMIEDSKNKLSLLRQDAKDFRCANVFCSGPSISEVFDMPKEKFRDGFNIVCNSMIKDRELMEKLRPNVLCFFDANFYHSPGKYGEAFYADLRETYKKYKYYIFVRDIEYPLLMKHCPEMKESIIGIPLRNSKEYWFVDEKNFAFRPLSNILTEIMIPLASAVCEEVRIAGCTGRSEEMNYFWKHNDRTQYTDLKKYVMETWPAFFNYCRYDAYYNRHCQNVEEQLQYGESQGKKYTNITTSYIPALAKRSIIV